MKNIFAVLIFTLSFHFNSHAGTLVEPYLGYQSVIVDAKTGTSLASIPFKLEGSGLGFGMRLGYSALLFFGALDIGGTSLQMKLKEGQVASSSGTSARTSLGGTLGLNLPFIRPYVGYIFNDQLIGSDSGLIGTGYKVGIGLGIIPKVKLNFEYYSTTFSKYKTDAAGEVTMPDASTYDSASMTGLMLNLSVPIDP